MNQVSFYFYCGLLIVFVSGLSLMVSVKKSKGRKYVKFRKSLVKDAKKKIIQELEDKKASRLLFEAGVQMDSYQYNGLRYGITILLLASQIRLVVKEGQAKPQFFLLAAGIFLLSIPTETVFGQQTPFGYVISTLKFQRKKQIDKEIFQTMTQLKNLCIAQTDQSLSGDYLIEQLIKFSSVTKPAFTKLLTLWRLGDVEKACTAFGDMLDTKMSLELSGIFMKLESMNPYELASHLELYQSHIREERMTTHLRKQEALSYLLYAPVIGSAFLIILNFMVIVIWLDTMELIQKI